jgi:membrane associated rhomboid family serine protease
MGHLRYLYFYLLGGVVSALGHVFYQPSSTVPCVGASGAIAGVLGAALILYPRARVVVLVPIFIFFRMVQMPAFIFLIIWFVGQVFLAHLVKGGEIQIAVAAHIVGFLYGLLAVFLFRKKASPIGF